MPSLSEIKKRIKVVESTSKITNAMKLVASAKLKKQKDLFMHAKEFYSNFYDIFFHIKANVEFSEKYFAKDASANKTIWIVFTSSMGLCGSYNVNLMKFLREKIENDKDEIILIGKKGASLLKNKNINNKVRLALEIEDKDITYDLCYILCKKIWEDFQDEKDIASIKIIYTKFINSLSFEPSIFSLIPIDERTVERISKPENGGIFVFTVKTDELFQSIISNYLSACVYGAMIESKVCENASRRNAMDSATENANDLIVSYKLEFNRIRQSDITQEITEIVSGSNSEEE